MNAKAFMVEVIQASSGTLTIIVRNTNGQPVLVTNNAAEVSAFLCSSIAA